MAFARVAMCVCASINPGATQRPARSITRTPPPRGSERVGAMRVIFVPSITIVASRTTVPETPSTTLALIR